MGVSKKVKGEKFQMNIIVKNNDLMRRKIIL